MHTKINSIPVVISLTLLLRAEVPLPQKGVWGSGGSRRSCYAGRRAKGVWDVVVDTSPDLGGKNVLRTFKTVIQHNRRPKRT